jgi:hypothetical protein
MRAKAMILGPKEADKEVGEVGPQKEQNRTDLHRDRDERDHVVKYNLIPDFPIPMKPY